MTDDQVADVRDLTRKAGISRLSQDLGQELGAGVRLREGLVRFVEGIGQGGQRARGGTRQARRRVGAACLVQLRRSRRILGAQRWQAQERLTLPAASDAPAARPPASRRGDGRRNDRRERAHRLECPEARHNGSVRGKLSAVLGAGQRALRSSTPGLAT
jgi:hypothetical protein